MAFFIALETTVFDHRKTLRLSIRLKMRPTHLVGHLSRLWTWALTNAPTGDLLDVEPEVIAVAADWTGDLLEIAGAEAFVAALVDVGFLDRREGGSDVLHGFRERHEAWADRREAEQRTAEDRETDRRRKQREAQARYRARQKGDVDGDGAVIGAAITRDRTGDDGGGDGDRRVNGADGAVILGVIGRDVTGLARPDRTGPDVTSPDMTGNRAPLHPPIAMGGSPPAPRQRGARRQRDHGAGSFFATRYGSLACPDGCPGPHGGPGGLSEVAALWRAHEDRGPWPRFARAHGRGDVGDDELPPGDSLGNDGGESGGGE